jgi:hypothetical protein
MKFKVFSCVMALVFAFSACGELFDQSGSEGNNGNGNNKVTNEYVAGAEFKLDFNNAQFHCNAISGNGRVWPVIPADMKKFDGQLTFTKAEGTRWNLTALKAAILDAKGKATGSYGADLSMVVCPVCGSTSWITFSNNSGVPDGKNIQMQHPGANFTINKEWVKNNESYDLNTKFFANFGITLGSDKTFKVGPGNFFLPEDLTATVEETGCTEGFELVQVKLNGEEVALGPVSDIVGGDAVTFVNEDEQTETQKANFNPSAILLETWKAETHKPIFKVESGSASGTLVTLTQGLSGGVFGNGHTWIPAEAGVRRIADSSPRNRAVGFTYTLERRADGWYIVLDEKIVSATIGAVGFDEFENMSQDDFRAPSHTTVNGVYGPIKTYVNSGNQEQAPAWTGAGQIFVHFNAISWSYETEDVIGCELESIELRTGPLTRNAVVSFVVSVKAGDNLGVTDLPLGTYTVSLLVDGEVISTQSVTLDVAGETKDVVFDEVPPIDDLDCVVVCGNCSSCLCE